jgi:hypothetical protein
MRCGHTKTARPSWGRLSYSGAAPAAPVSGRTVLERWEARCVWCHDFFTSKPWDDPTKPYEITHEMVHSFMQAFPDITPPQLL